MIYVSGVSPFEGMVWSIMTNTASEADSRRLCLEETRRLLCETEHTGGWYITPTIMFIQEIGELTGRLSRSFYVPNDSMATTVLVLTPSSSSRTTDLLPTSSATEMGPLSIVLTEFGSPSPSRPTLVVEVTWLLPWTDVIADVIGTLSLIEEELVGPTVTELIEAPMVTPTIG